MASQEHLDLLLRHKGQQRIETWNKWRDQNPDIVPDFSDADLSMLKFMGGNLNRANLRGANLEWSDLLHTTFVGADFTGAKLCGVDARYGDFRSATLVQADLSGIVLLEANFEGATLANCSVYGVSAWNVKLEGATQSNLIITRPGEPRITVDNLEVAQFIYMLLNHRKIRDMLNSVTEKGVLILGRFGGGGLQALRRLAAELSAMGYLPMIFDFERPRNRDYTETIQTLASLSRFVIADLSGPSVPQELYATVPHIKVPYAPIIERGRHIYSMFSDLRQFAWVLWPPVEFSDDQELVTAATSLVARAEERNKERQRLIEEIFGKVT